MSATIAVDSLNGMNVSFSVYDDLGNLLALSSPGATNYTAGLNNLVSPANGTYFIQVSGDVGVDFNLVLTKGADFTTQPNSAPSTAQNITATQQSGDNRLGGVVGSIVNPSGAFLATTIEGIDANGSDCGCEPPDTNAAVGNGFVAETVNMDFRVWDTTGNIILDEPLNALLDGGNTGGEPYVEYDAVANRWFVTSIDNNAPGDEYLSVSTDGTPIDGFTTYQVPLAAPGDRPDFAKFGYNASAIVIEAQDYSTSTSNFVQTVVTTVDIKALIGGTLTYYQSVPPAEFRALTPAQMTDDTAGTTMWFMSTDGENFPSNTIRVTEMTNLLSNSPVYTTYSLAVNTFGDTALANQPGAPGSVQTNGPTTTSVDYLDGKMVTALTATDASDNFSQSHVHWYEVDVSSGTPVLVQEGLINPGPGVATYFGSAAIDPVGNIGISYMQSSSTEYVSASVAGHIAGTPLGTTTAGTVIAPGGGLIPNSVGVGGYGSAVYDPGSGLFWGANEYNGSDGSTDIWRTKVASFAVLATIGTDYYSVNANAGDNLHFSTTTPGGGPSEFINNFYPELLLFDPNGNLVAVAAGNGADGRNSVIDFTVPDGDAGQWVIEVTPSPNTPQPTQGEYGLLVTGATGSLSPYVVTSTTPPPGALVQPPSAITVSFNDPVYVPSLTAGELEVNGVPATAVSDVNGNTVTWTIDPNSYATGIDLPNVVTIGADAFGNQIMDVSGQTLIPFSYTFFTTNVAPAIVSSSVDGQVFSPAPANPTEIVTFSQPMNTSFTTASSFALHGNYRSVSYAAASWSWDPTGTILTINFSGLPDDSYTITLLAGGFDNVVGIPLASDYIANFAVTLGEAAFGGEFTPFAPAGSLIYTGTDTHVLATSTDIDYLTVNLNAGETLTVIATPTTPSLQLVTGVFDPAFNLIGITTAPAQGDSAVLETVTAATTGTYEIAVADINGGLGLYSIQAYLNTYAKQGTANDTIGTAQGISGSSFLLGTSGADRLGVVGSLPSNPVSPPVPDTQDYYSFSLSQGESATIVATSQNGDNLAITLVDGNGNVLASGVGGATNVNASIENFVATFTGKYYVEITGDPGLQYSLVVMRDATFSIEPHNTISTAESVTGTDGVLGDLASPSTVVNDWYLVNVQAGQALSLQSSTPSDQGGQFPNTASLEIELFDSFGNLVAVGTKLSDGRNEALFFNAPITGAYHIKVIEDPGGAGEYYVAVNTASYPSGSASGEVFNDLNGSGSLIPGDPGLTGWEVDLYDANNNFVASQLTDANGDFNFQGLAPGTYTVAEKLHTGWTQTAPPPLSFTISVTAGSTVTSLDFGDFQNITISGQAYDDLNDNGTADPGEPGLRGWTIDLLDANGNILATTTTDAQGDYNFAGVGPGVVTVSEVLMTGWTQTQPINSASYSLTTQSGFDETGLNFGNFRMTTVSGVVYNDISGSGIPSPLDPNLANWTIDLENTSGNVLASVLSTSTGRFSFTSVPAGTYLIAEVVPANWVQTEPFYPTVYTINTQSGMNVSGLVFGDHASPALNPSAVIDNGQPGYAETGSWSTAPGGYGGTSRIAATTSGSVATATASWTFNGLTSGSYAVYVTYVGHSTYSAAAPFTVYDGGSSLGTVDIKESILVTQSHGGPSQGSYGGVGWLRLGTYTINSGTLEVLLRNSASGQFVDANGILIVPQSTPAFVSLSSTGANSDAPSGLGTIPPIATTNLSQTPSTTVSGKSPTVAISGVSAPSAVHLVYNQGATTINTTTASNLIDEALNQVGTAGKKKSSKRLDVRGAGMAVIPSLAPAQAIPSMPKSNPGFSSERNNIHDRTRSKITCVCLAGRHGDPGSGRSRACRLGRRYAHA